MIFLINNEGQAWIDEHKDGNLDQQYQKVHPLSHHKMLQRDFSQRASFPLVDGHKIKPGNSLLNHTKKKLCNCAINAWLSSIKMLHYKKQIKRLLKKKKQQARAYLQWNTSYNNPLQPSSWYKTSIWHLLWLCIIMVSERGRVKYAFFPLSFTNKAFCIPNQSGAPSVSFN